MKSRYYALYWLWKHICAIDQAWGLRWLDIGQVLSCVFLDPDEVWDIAILTLTSPTDINFPTTSALVLVTKDSFVSLVTNLNNKKQCLWTVTSSTLYGQKGAFACGTNAGNPERPAQLTNQKKKMGIVTPFKMAAIMVPSWNLRMKFNFYNVDEDKSLSIYLDKISSGITNYNYIHIS